MEVLRPEYRRIMEIVAKASGPVMAKDVALALGRENTPAKVEPVRGQFSLGAAAAGTALPAERVLAFCAVVMAAASGAASVGTGCACGAGAGTLENVGGTVVPSTGAVVTGSAG